jgi:DNA sulfur modification protein DndC
MNILAKVKELGFTVRVVMPAMDDSVFVYVLGRGVPPPSNTFRWCTGQLKVEPMVEALKSLRDEYGKKFLMLTGVRIGRERGPGR